jgi:hypothetical protein
MSYKLAWLHASALRVEQRATKLTLRESFPRHLKWSEMPIGRTGHSGRCLVGCLMTRVALKPGSPVISGTARHIHRMAMPVIALARKIRVRMTVHAARMEQHGDHLRKKSRRSGARGLARVGRMYWRYSRKVTAAERQNAR